MSSVFLSDIHLKPWNDPRTLVLVNYLNSLGSEVESVFFLGDIFDFWMGGHQIWQDRYRPFVEAVQKLRTQGKSVYFFEGNHDIHIHSFWQDILDVEVFVEPKVFELYGKRVRIEHGDLFNPEDRNYIYFRNFLRSGPMKLATRLAPGGLVAAIADWGSATSHKYSSRRGREASVIADIRRRMKNYFLSNAQTQKIDMLIMGHTHIREDYEINIEDRPVRFVNLGSWFEPDFKIFVLDPSGGRFEDIKKS